MSAFFVFEELGSEVSRESESWQATEQGEFGVTCRAQTLSGERRREENISERGAIVSAKQSGLSSISNKTILAQPRTCR